MVMISSTVKGRGSYMVVKPLKGGAAFDFEQKAKLIAAGKGKGGWRWSCNGFVRENAAWKFKLPKSINKIK